MRTCVGCRAVVPQRELARVVVDGPRLVVDRLRRKPGRGAYVHPVPACVTAPGLARSLRRGVTPAEVAEIVTQLSRAEDNSQSSPDFVRDSSENPDDQQAWPYSGDHCRNVGLGFEAKDDRKTDARV